MNSKSGKWVIRIGIGLAIIGLIVIFLVFRSVMNATLNETTESYLIGNVDALSTAFFTKLDDQMVMLESQTRYFRDVDLTDYNKMKETIMSTKGIGAFKSIGVASLSGATMDYNGKSAGNILLSDYFKAAVAGENAVSNPASRGDNNGELVMAVPIKSGEDIVGIVYGNFDPEVLNSLVGSVRFADNAANLLIDSAGNIIAKTIDTPWISERADNLLDEIPGLVLPGEGEDTFYKYSKNGANNIAVLTPVGMHDWYFATVIPEELVTEQNRKVERYVVWVIVGVAMVFIILMLIIYLINRRARRIEHTNEKLMTVSEQTGDIVLEYHYNSGRLTMDGDVGDLVRKRKIYYNEEDIDDLLGRLHSEDEELYDQLHQLSEISGDTVVYDGRILCTDMKYKWFRLSLQMERGKDGKLSSLIGSLTNIDERMNKEQSLQQQAAKDLLTGILNKVAFGERVEAAIPTIPMGGRLVFFIIDLDNFKQVNDRLGHVVGDEVLKDVSEKLKILFSERSVIGRIGGDEFAAFMIQGMEHCDSDNTIRDQAYKVCDALRKTVSNEDGSIEIHVSSSIGISLCPRDAETYEGLYKTADKALYISKSDGKDRYTIWRPECAEREDVEYISDREE